MDFQRRLQESLGDQYAIERELGGGGMSRVFLARDTALGRDVVVKVLSPELSATLSVERFTREIKLSAALQEPHIVQVLGTGRTANGLPWYTMPFVKGDSLRARLAAGTLPLAESVGVLRDIARALAYAHEHGVVHRDIKPENVLLSSGTAVVTDFGIAKALSVSKTDVGGGTLTYMAPEQALADDSTDYRADIYSWGVLAYELLAGAHPFADKKTPQALIAAHISEVPAPIGPRVPQLPAAISSLVTQCLEKSPDARPQEMKQVVALLADGGTVATPPGGPPRAVAPTVTGRPRWLGIAAAVAVVVIALLGWRAFGGGSGTKSGTIETLAVLPFVNVGGDTKDEYFSDGITDELAHGLSSIHGLRLAGRSSSFAFKGKNVTAKEIGRQLDVAALIEGTVRRAGDRVRITVQLTSGADGKVLWQDAYENDKGDVFQVQDNVAKAVVAALAPMLRGQVEAGPTTASLASRGTSDTAAYDLYLQGRFFWTRRGTANLNRAATLFREAIAKDPRFARAYAGLGLVYAVLPSWSDAPPQDSTAIRAEAAARAAIALDSTLADPWLVLSSVRREHLQFSEALKFGSTALRLEPSNATAHQWQALIFGGEGVIDSALVEIRKATALDPLSNTIANNEVSFLNVAGDFENAKRAAARILERDSLHYYARMNLAITHVFSGHADSALHLIQIAERVPHNVSGSLGREVFAYAALGRWSDAERLRARIAEGRDSLVSELDGMAAAMAFGDHRAAIALLKVGLAKQGQNPSWFHSPSCDPLFAPLRDDPAFIALMNGYGMTICKTPVRWPIPARR